MGTGFQQGIAGWVQLHNWKHKHGMSLPRRGMMVQSQSSRFGKGQTYNNRLGGSVLSICCNSVCGSLIQLDKYPHLCVHQLVHCPSLHANFATWAPPQRKNFSHHLCAAHQRCDSPPNSRPQGSGVLIKAQLSTSIWPSRQHVNLH